MAEEIKEMTAEEQKMICVKCGGHRKCTQLFNSRLGTICYEQAMYVSALETKNETIRALESKLKACMELVENYSAVTETSVALSKRAADKIEQLEGQVKVLGEQLKMLVEAGNKIKKFHAFVPDAVAFLNFEETLKASEKWAGRKEQEWISHIVQEGARFHVVSYSNQGRHCSEPMCEINKPSEEGAGRGE